MMLGKKTPFSALSPSLLLLYVLMILPFSGSLATAQKGVNLSATLSTTHFNLGSSATLRIRINGARSAEIHIPEIDNLIFHERGQSSQMQLINGTFSSSITSTYVIEALKEGSYSIPPFTVDAGGTTLTTESLNFEVSSSSSPSNAATDSREKTNAEGLAFVTVQGITGRAYTGEVMPVTIKAYFQRKIGAEITAPPALTGDGFILSPPESEPLQGVENYQGRTYSVISWQSAITPIRDGRHKIAIDVGAILQLPLKNRPSGNRLFDDDFFSNDLFDSFFGNVRQQKVKMQTNPQTVTVIPLPEKGRPPGFDGAVGNFDFTVTAQPQAVAAGEPITLTMTISGKGNFDRVSVPEFPADENWKSYSANGTFFSSGNSYSGKKVFERAVVAKSAALTAIPSLRFSYFDPARKSYVTLNSDPLSLHVEEEESADENIVIPPAKPGNPGDVKEKQASPPSMQTRVTSGDFHEEIAPLFERTWFWFTVFLCTALLLALAVYSLTRRYRLNTLEQLQKRKLQHMIQTGLVTLHEAAAAGDDVAFLTGCRHLIRLRLASEWNMEPAAISLYDLEWRLSGDSALVEIFSTAQQHAYGGLHLNSRQMNTLLIRLRDALEEEP